MRSPKSSFLRNSLSLLGFAFTLFLLLLTLLGTDTDEALASRHGGQTGPLKAGNLYFTPPPHANFGGYVWGTVFVDGHPKEDVVLTMTFGTAVPITAETMLLAEIEPYPIYMFGIRPLSELGATLGSTVTISINFENETKTHTFRLLPNESNEIEVSFAFGPGDPRLPTPTPPVLPAASDTFTTVVSNRLIDVGIEHSCVISTSGGLQCWGRNDLGQLGNVNFPVGTLANEPVDVVGLNSGIRSVVTGERHTCALLQNGRVKCWGWYRYDWQISDKEPYVAQVPYDKPQISDAIDIAAGNFFTCVLLANRTVQCWGANSIGELGNGQPAHNGPNTEPSYVVAGNGSIATLQNVTAISVRRYAACVIVETGVKCWGNGALLGSISTTPISVPVDIPGLQSGVSAISVGDAAACAIKSDHTVWCWGSPLHPIYHDHPELRGLPIQIATLPADIVKIVMSYQHLCALRQNGTVLCWGEGDLDQLSGQLGPDIIAGTFTPTLISGVANVVDISTNRDNVCVRLTNGTVQCWGSNYWGQLGDGNGFTFPFPTDAPTQTTVFQAGATAVTTGDYHTCALSVGGGVSCWGANTYGQLGNGTISHLITDAVSVTALDSSVTAVTAGSHHSCALTTAGAVRCWGRNNYGQLGNGTTIDSSTPVTVNGLTSGVQEIVAGADHTCVLLATGEIRCWGINDGGQLGKTPTVIVPTPVAILGLVGRSVAVAVGNAHSCAVIESGITQCWGNNAYGQLGLPLTISGIYTPTTVTGIISGTTAIAAGYEHTCAIVNGGTRCWGSGVNGQLGNGFNNNNFPGSKPYSSTVPIQVTGLTSNTIDIQTGAGSSCASLVDGSLRCWGGGTDGNLGDNRSDSSLVPVKVVGLQNVTQFDLRRNHVCARLADSSLYCWGDNLYGQIGNGIAQISSTPVTVKNITPAKWTYMLYLVGDNDLAAPLNQIDRLLNKPQFKQKELNIAIFYDGQGSNDSYIWSTRNPSTDRWHLREAETSLSDPQNLTAFIQWARNNYPAEHYYLSIVDHGRPTTGIGWDSQNGTDDSNEEINVLTMAEVRQALHEATQQGESKIDILHFDACLMAMLEVAYEVQDYAKYMIASQNLTAAFYPYDEYAQLVIDNPQITATQLAVDIANKHFDYKYLQVNEQPRTISVFNLQEITPVVTAFENFAVAISTTATVRAQLPAIRAQVQVFDASPDLTQDPPSYYTLTPDDEYVDLYDLAERLKDVAGVASAAQALLERLQPQIINAVDTGISRFVVLERKQSGFDKLVSGKEWKLDKSHGVSIYFPMNAAAYDYQTYIADTNPIFTFTANSRWDEFLKTYLGVSAASEQPIRSALLPPVLKPTKPITIHCGDSQPCLWGAVYLDGVAQNNVEVTLQIGTNTQVTTTAFISGNEAYPVYAFALDSLQIPNGTPILLTAQAIDPASGQRYEITQTTRLALIRREMEVNPVKQSPSATPTPSDIPPTQVTLNWATLVTSTNTSGQPLIRGNAHGSTNNQSKIIEYRWTSDRDGIIASTNSFALPLQSLSTGTQVISVTAINDTNIQSAPVIFEIQIPAANHYQYLPIVLR